MVPAMPADQPRHLGGTPRRSERAIVIGVTVTSMALLSALALMYWNPPWITGTTSATKFVGAPHTARPTPTEPVRASQPVDRAPLTGLPVDNPLTRAAVTVKVSNTPDAHPHRGLEDADIVFVEPITGSTTRLAAIFHSRVPDEVGPVRSLRPMDAAIVGPTAGVLANTMAQQWVLDYIDAKADVANLGTMQVPRGTYRIDNTRFAPNHVFAQPAVLLELSERNAPPPPYFQYAADPNGTTAATDGLPAAAVTIDYGGSSTTTWRYDADAAQWRRAEAWSDHILEIGEQVTTDNVIVLRARRDYGFAQAGPDMTVLDLDNSSGSLQLFTGAAVVDGRWSKAGINEPFEFTTRTGEDLLLTPGSTWVELALDTMAVTIEAPERYAPTSVASTADIAAKAPGITR